MGDGAVERALARMTIHRYTGELNSQALATERAIGPGANGRRINSEPETWSVRLVVPASSVAHFLSFVRPSTCEMMPHHLMFSPRGHLRRLRLAMEGDALNQAELGGVA